MYGIKRIQTKKKNQKLHLYENLKNSDQMKSFAVLILLLINQLIGTPESKDTIIYLILHAEKEAIGNNP